MSFPTTTAGLRLAAFVAVPVLALTVACGGSDDDAGAKGRDAIADVPSPKAEPSGESTAGAETTPSAKPAGKSAYYDAQVAFVRCMRAEGGYPEYPDPKLSGYLDWAKINELGSQPGRNHGIKAGKNNVCLPELQASMAAEPKRDQQKSYESMLAHAQCMRDNGVSRFTNPVMSGGNAIPGGDPNPGSPVIDPESPAYKKAREACASKLLDGLDGMQ
ncbi:hypothetical protein ACF058_14780 [Streptomyces sp. NPDC015501]|uniref:hypothetical protein n=1 Tax=unclassified Streptomyces TaxID=2593676 RepID=UPI0011A1D3DB|nr:hypothetical protein A3L22_16905 [Streptomyces griseus subsp. griseus]WSS56935.1 hypothetical protein OG543_17000 [Streptomyces sp. NBC_01178]